MPSKPFGETLATPKTCRAGNKKSVKASTSDCSNRQNSPEGSCSGRRCAPPCATLSARGHWHGLRRRVRWLLPLSVWLARGQCNIWLPGTMYWYRDFEFLRSSKHLLHQTYIEAQERARCAARARLLYSITGKSALVGCERCERAPWVTEVIREREERYTLYIEPERARSLPSTSAHQGSPRWSGSVKSASSILYKYLERARSLAASAASAHHGSPRWSGSVFYTLYRTGKSALAAKHERAPGVAEVIREREAPHGWLLGCWGCEDTKGKLCAWMAQKRTEQRAKLMTCIFAQHGMLARSGKSPGFWRWRLTARIYVFHGSVSLLQWRKKMIKRKTLLNKKKQQKNLGWS